MRSNSIKFLTTEQNKCEFSTILKFSVRKKYCIVINLKKKGIKSFTIMSSPLSRYGRRVAEQLSTLPCPPPSRGIQPLSFCLPLLLPLVLTCRRTVERLLTLMASPCNFLFFFLRLIMISSNGLVKFLIMSRILSYVMWSTHEIRRHSNAQIIFCNSNIDGNDLHEAIEKMPVHNKL